jgi:hypothetical protein
MSSVLHGFPQDCPPHRTGRSLFDWFLDSRLRGNDTAVVLTGFPVRGPPFPRSFFSLLRIFSLIDYEFIRRLADRDKGRKR